MNADIRELRKKALKAIGVCRAAAIAINDAVTTGACPGECLGGKSSSRKIVATHTMCRESRDVSIEKDNGNFAFYAKVSRLHGHGGGGDDYSVNLVFQHLQNGIIDRLVFWNTKQKQMLPHGLQSATEFIDRDRIKRVVQISQQHRNDIGLSGYKSACERVWNVIQSPGRIEYLRPGGVGY
jgi:hypothetical protein